MAIIGIDGDGGDCIASMVIARDLGGASYKFHQGRNPRPFEGIAKMLIPLFQSQSYIKGAEWTVRNPPDVTHDLCHWRAKFYKPNQTLVQSMANSLDRGALDYAPWIAVEPSIRTRGKIVIARTPRYNNPKFPWRNVISRFRSRLVFLGVDQERHKLEAMVGFKIEHLRIGNFLDAAQAIAGSDLLISNQTIYYWIGAAMGHPLVQETETTRRIHDSQVPRANSVFCENGDFPFNTLPKKMTFEYNHNYEI